MNLHSPIFDAIRIPSRATPDFIASQVCAEMGVLPSSIIGVKQYHDYTREVRNAVLIAMRKAHITTPAITEWFGVGEATVSRWFAELGEAGK